MTRCLTLRLQLTAAHVQKEAGGLCARRDHGTFNAVPPAGDSAAAETRSVMPQNRRGPTESFTDVLRGYAFPIHRRDNFTCRYCGLDGRSSFAAWLSLSEDHLLPKGHPQRDNPDFIVTACMFCNTADNRYFDLAEKRGLRFDSLSSDELVAQRRPFVEATRAAYRDFWETNVRGAQGIP